MFFVLPLPGRLEAIRYLGWTKKWKSLMTDLKAAKAGNPNLEIQEIMDERICEKCVLWPDIGADWAAFSKAGTVPTLAEAIRESSNFVPLDIAMRLVRRLG